MTLIIIIIIIVIIHLFTVDKKCFAKLKSAKREEKAYICIKALALIFFITFKILSKFQDYSCGKVK